MFALPLLRERAHALRAVQPSVRKALRATAGILLSVVLAVSIAAGVSAQGVGAINKQELYSLTNITRNQYDKPPLSAHAGLEAAAAAKAQHIFANQYWAHFAPDGTSPWFFMDSAGVNYISAGENLAKGFSSSQDVSNGWNNSPTHFDNVVGDYSHFGISVRSGELLGYRTTVVVAMYAQIENAAPVTQAARRQTGTTQPAANSSQTPQKDVLSEQSSSKTTQREQPAAPRQKESEQQIVAETTNNGTAQSTAQQTGQAAVEKASEIFTNDLSKHQGLRVQLVLMIIGFIGTLVVLPFAF